MSVCVYVCLCGWVRVFVGVCVCGWGGVFCGCLCMVSVYVRVCDFGCVMYVSMTLLSFTCSLLIYIYIYMCEEETFYQSIQWTPTLLKLLFFDCMYYMYYMLVLLEGWTVDLCEPERTLLTCECCVWLSGWSAGTQGEQRAASHQHQARHSDSTPQRLQPGVSTEKTFPRRG